MVVNEKSDFRLIDGRRVPVAKLVMDSRTRVSRLDAPYGYRKLIDFGSGIQDQCTVYVTMGIGSDIQRYATVSTPDSDKLVSFRCRQLNR